MDSNWAAERERMVEHQLRARGISDARVLTAMGEIPREEFVPAQQRRWTYEDEPLPIGHGQTISQPYMTALMAQCLRLQGEERVLDIGSGSGYHAAILGALCARVVSVEILPELAEFARSNLQRTGRGGNVEVICADGSGGYPKEAPYDGISVAAGAPGVPCPLVDQLVEGGRLVIPVGDYADQELRIITRRQGKTESSVAAFCRFVPLRGSQGWR